MEIPLAVLKEVNCDLAVDLFLASEIPPGTGLGSSASVCVNILKTLTTYIQRPLSKYELAEKAFHIARNVLGKQVGKQDEYAAAFGGVNFISFHEDGSTLVEPIHLNPAVLTELQRNLMLFFTGSAHHSWSILKEQESSARNQTGGCPRSSARSERLGNSHAQTHFNKVISESWALCCTKGGRQSDAYRRRSRLPISMNCTLSLGNTAP